MISEGHKIAIVFINFSVIALFIAVFLNNRFKERQSKLFVAMGIFMLLWVDFAYAARILGFVSLAYSELSLRIAWIATPLFFFFTYLISVTLIKKTKKLALVSWILFGIAAALSLLTAFSNLIIAGIKFSDGNVDIIYGSGFYPFLVAIFVIMVFTLRPLLSYKIDKAVKAFLVGVVIFYVLNLIFNISLPVFFGITHLYYWGDYSTIVLLSLTAYAIIQHNLFNVRIIGAELLTMLIWMILLSNIFLASNNRELVIDIAAFVLSVVFGIFLIRSVVEEVKQKEKLQELTAKLKALDKQKDEFISMAAHEMRAPLTAIKGYVSMVVGGDFGDVPEKAKEYLVDASAVNDRLIRLVNNMLNVSRIEEGRMVYNTGYVYLSEIAKIIHTSFKFEAERKGLTFDLDIAPGVRDLVLVDQDRIHEVVGNFVSNSIKYTEKGGIIIRLFNSNSKTVRMEVVDTGPGISHEEQRKLFNKFYRVESTAGKTIGTGLGLYISKLLVEKFGGKIGLESSLGNGSNFWFELPLREKKNDLTAGSGDHENKPH